MGFSILIRLFFNFILERLRNVFVHQWEPRSHPWFLFICVKGVAGIVVKTKVAEKKISYLCEHYGKHLNDVIGYSKKGKPITIEIACIRKMMKLINLKTRDYYRSVSLEALTPVSEPSYEIKEEVAQDYTLYEKIVLSLNLTENMRIALECRQNGLSYPEIGRVLSRTQATVYEYFIKMRQRYMAIYG